MPISRAQDGDEDGEYDDEDEEDFEENFGEQGIASVVLVNELRDQLMGDNAQAGPRVAWRR